MTDTSRSTMRAATYERTGPAADVLHVTEIPAPAPGPGEVRVRLAWSGVNPSDVKSRGRAAKPAFPRIVPHSDGAGVVDAVGEGVPASRIGERVWTWNAQWGRADGTAAELVVLPSAQAVRLPDGVALEVGASLGIPALTAWKAVHTDGGVAGQRVLVAGGAGAVGHYAVQMAKLAGAARVVATTSTPEKAALARAAGADATVDYRAPDAAARLREAAGGAGFDRIIEVDIAANVALDIEVVAPDGLVVVYGTTKPETPLPFGPLIMKNVGLRYFVVYHLSPADRERSIRELTALLERGALQHNIAARLPLDRIVEAHELVEQGKVAGNVIVSVAETAERDGSQ